MDPRDHHSECSKSEKKEIPYNIPYMQNQKKKKKIQMTLFTKQKQAYRLRE